jgi:hypothetical protein
MFLTNLTLFTHSLPAREEEEKEKGQEEKERAKESRKAKIRTLSITPFDRLTQLVCRQNVSTSRRSNHTV